MKLPVHVSPLASRFLSILMLLTNAISNEHSTTPQTPLGIPCRVRDHQAHQHRVATTIAGQDVHGEQLAARRALWQQPEQKRSEESAGDGDGDEERAPSRKPHREERGGQLDSADHGTGRHDEQE